MTEKQLAALKLGWGHKQSEETRRKLALINTGRKATSKQLEALNLGRKKAPTIWTNERRKKASESRLNSLKIPRGFNHHSWKGDNVSYRSLHRWVVRYLGKPTICNKCQKTVIGKGIHWANISGEYKRDLKDWIRLCARCHAVQDGRSKSAIFNH